MNINNIGFKKIIYMPAYGTKKSDAPNHLVVTFTKKYIEYSLLPIFRATSENCKVDIKYDTRKSFGEFDAKDYKIDYCKLENTLRKMRKEGHYSDDKDDYMPPEIRMVLDDGTNETIVDCEENGAIIIIGEIAKKYMPPLLKQIINPCK